MLINCRCGAKHNPHTRWALGRYEGTTTTFYTQSHVKPGHCPVCLKQPIGIFQDKQTGRSLTM